MAPSERNGDNDGDDDLQLEMTTTGAHTERGNAAGLRGKSPCGVCLCAGVVCNWSRPALSIVVVVVVGSAQPRLSPAQLTHASYEPPAAGAMFSPPIIQLSANRVVLLPYSEAVVIRHCIL